MAANDEEAGSGWLSEPDSVLLEPRSDFGLNELLAPS